MLSLDIIMGIICTEAIDDYRLQENNIVDLEERTKDYVMGIEEAHKNAANSNIIFKQECSKSATEFNKITRRVTRKSAQHIGEVRYKRDTIWSKLANQIVGAEYIEK